MEVYKGSDEQTRHCMGVLVPNQPIDGAGWVYTTSRKRVYLLSPSDQFAM